MFGLHSLGPQSAGPCILRPTLFPPGLCSSPNASCSRNFIAAFSSQRLDEGRATSLALRRRFPPKHQKLQLSPTLGPFTSLVPNNRTSPRRASQYPTPLLRCRGWACCSHPQANNTRGARERDTGIAERPGGLSGGLCGRCAGRRTSRIITSKDRGQGTTASSLNNSGRYLGKGHPSRS